MQSQKDSDERDEDGRRTPRKRDKDGEAARRSPKRDEESHGASAWEKEREKTQTGCVFIEKNETPQRKEKHCHGR